MLPFPLLQELDLSQNRIRLFPTRFLRYTSELRKLNISHNKIEVLESEFFVNLSKLHTLDISENRLDGSNVAFLTHLPSLKVLKASYFIDCCYANEKRPDIKCEAHENAFSDCKGLLRDPVVRYLIWIMIVFTLIGNISVFVSRFFVEDTNISQKLFITSLGISDLLMGVYLTIVASKDQLWRGRYFLHDLEWRQSTSCLVASVLSMVSSQASLLTLVAITYDRFRSITNVMQMAKISFRRALAIVVTIWCISGTLTLLSVFNPFAAKEEEEEEEEEESVSMVYSSNAVCFPLKLRGKETRGWEYSFVLYGVVNLLLSCYLVIAYIWMFVTIHKTSKVRSTRMKTESALAKRMLCLVLSDLICWLPVIVFVFLSFLDIYRDSDGTIFAILAVCAIPINSALNPLLYTISTPAVVNVVNKLLGRNER